MSYRTSKLEVNYPFDEQIYESVAQNLVTFFTAQVVDGKIHYLSSLNVFQLN